MTERGGKNLRQQGKTFGEKKGAAFFAKLPDNYSEMSEQDQKEWRKHLAQAILEHHTNERIALQGERVGPNEVRRAGPAD